MASIEYLHSKGESKIPRDFAFILNAENKILLCYLSTDITLNGTSLMHTKNAKFDSQSNGHATHRDFAGTILLLGSSHTYGVHIFLGEGGFRKVQC